MFVDGEEVTFRSTQEAREAGIETVYQTLAVAPALDIASNMFLAREQRRKGPLGSVLRMLDTGGMKRRGQASTSTTSASAHCRTSTRRSRRSPAGSAKRSPSHALRRSAARSSSSTSRPRRSAFARPARCCGSSRDLRSRGLGIILISHNMPNVFEVADRIHIQRLGRSAGVVTPKTHTPAEAVAIMTGATTLDQTPGSAATAASA